MGVLIFSIFSGLLVFGLGVIVHSFRQKKAATHIPSDSKSNAQEVGAFYDATNAAFVKVYGHVIQAFRTNNLDNLLAYQSTAMGLEPGMVVVDAGCGVCGPAAYFARHAGVSVKAVTASQVQAEESRKRIQAENLSGAVTVFQHDYHDLPAIIAPGSADVVYFLESFGHSNQKSKALDAAWEVLKPGGKLYIKDLFLKEPLSAAEKPLMAREVKRINDAYHYNIGDLYEVLRAIRQKGWILANLKTVDLPLDDFENLSISNDFQELTGIGRIDAWGDYVFPVEFFEIHCIKPWHDPAVGNNRYFLQNLYYMTVKGKSVAEIAEMRMNPEQSK